MAISVQWSDLHHNIESGSSGGIRVVTNVDSVKTSIDNILRTRYNSRVMLPEFGTGLQDMLFSSMTQDLSGAIAKDVKRAIERWENRVVVNTVNVYQSTDEHYIKIEVVFSIIGYDDIFTTESVF